MTENDLPDNSNLVRLSRFGKELLKLSSPDDRQALILSTLRTWYQAEVESFGFQINELSDRGGQFKKLLRELPAEFYPLLDERIRAVPLVMSLFTGSFLNRHSRPRKYLTIPFLADEKEWKFVRLVRHGKGRFTYKELDELQSIIIFISFAFLTWNKTNQFSLLVELTNAITSLLSLDELVNEAAQFIHTRLGYENISIFTVHPGRQKVIYQTGTGTNVDNYPERPNGFDVNAPLGLIPFVARTGRSFLCNNVLSEPLYQKEKFSEGTRSELVIPMVYGSETLGILDFQSDFLDAFSEEEVKFLETIAHNLAIAIRNAGLYRSEQWRRKVADSVREVAGLLTADIDLEHVLDSILTELEKALPCDFSAVWLLESSEKQDVDNNPQNLNLSAVHISDSGNWYFRDESEAVTSDFILQVCGKTPLANPWLLEVLNATHPLIRTINTPYEPIASILDFSEDHSAIATPLLAGGHPLGVLVLGHATPGRYGHEAQQLTATFASYAAVAIQNTRLYTAAHDQAWVSTVLLQVADATESINDLDQLLDTMARITPKLIGVRACVIFYWDEDIKGFVPKSTSGLDEESHNEIMDWIIYDDQFPEFANLRMTKNQVIISKQENSEVINRLYALFPLDSGLLAIFPMISRGNFIGAFLIDFKESVAQGLNNHRELLLDENTSIIQGIAHQTAVAVENIQLYASQKEETYVSIALLQVAQAIVSLNSLEDILETIVRITPILVGMKRVVIYLWEESQKVFNLTHSYGISRQEMVDLKRLIKPEEFPLLNLVQNCLCPAFIALDQDTDDNPLNWNQFSEEDISFMSPVQLGSSDSKTDLEKFAKFYDKDEILLIPSTLLYAYPLSVKGSLLGILVTQEAYNKQFSVSPRIRSRRQEITTGITQQAALAIQNEKLQREAVERERLERELQLAREIQQTFLPNSLPVIPGWDLDVLWRPAREVGGDFYDVFPLPGNRFGIVIADVADKGMPAALFMTLVRTLIRATAREELSPAIVLETVNDLLVADSQRGLFITTFYLVITPLTGQFLYANAGHNPPLLMRSASQSLESLSPTGMALGVLEDIDIKEYLITLEPGDGIVLYTDGVTESFSADGEMYSESRLRSVLLDFLVNNPTHTATDLKDLVDKSVQSFSEGCAISDDLTLVTLKRKI